MHLTTFAVILDMHMDNVLMSLLYIMTYSMFQYASVFWKELLFQYIPPQVVDVFVQLPIGALQIGFQVKDVFVEWLYTIYCTIAF